MSEEERRFADDEQDKKPSVLIAVVGRTRDIEVDYENSIIEYQDDYDCSPPLFLNKIGKKHTTDLILVLGNGYNLIDKTCLSTMIDIMLSDRFTGFGALYTDAIVMHEGRILCKKINPSYDTKIVINRLPLNVPFIVISSLFPSFDEKIEELYLWDGILGIVKHSMIYHVPKVFFRLDNALSNVSIQGEFKRINEIHYS